jgi:hypothetical protein
MKLVGVYAFMYAFLKGAGSTLAQCKWWIKGNRNVSQSKWSGNEITYVFDDINFLIDSELYCRTYETFR